ncbi:cell division protein ZapA [Geobacillus subterraneus]|uniref:Cell division protein ZapA n=2 Tax=Geobacillus TaxID=129337 RepID=A0ABN4NDN8_9BACL|nr:MULTISPECIES: cell division protein ZapA [Geobacillus]AMX82678.1 cell division protein ZapA [Geobacillus subterraneus]KZS26240.1 cell division protein ZapA [Geobacillus subterraneus]OQP06394.1 cell division protein ZapA [Geobacillus sp. 46C-IIa]OXB90770.1 cell division protein ZapA [Geobacillus uzenensis]QIZ68598.1 cell division protein ZapA [Geobacillus subterraneus]
MTKQPKTRVSVRIYGQDYTIVGTESPAHIRLVAAFVDDKMHEFSERNPMLDVPRLAVLTAVNIANEYLKLKQEYDRLAAKLKEEKDGEDDD